MNSPYNPGARSPVNSSVRPAFCDAQHGSFSLSTAPDPEAPMATTQAESTPNPNSLKFTTDDGPFLSGGVAAYSSADEAAEDPLARRLFGVSGVDDVFITPQFVTVSKAPSVDWGGVTPDVETIRAEHLEAA